MGDDAIYADGSPELFDAASDLLMDKVMKSRKVKDQQIYDLAIKALDYYREYLQQNQPFDNEYLAQNQQPYDKTTNLHPVYKSKASWAPYKPGKAYKPKVDDIVDCYGNMVGILPSVKVSCDPSKGTVLTIPATNILRMDVNYGSSGNVVRTVEYVDKVGA